MSDISLEATGGEGGIGAGDMTPEEATANEDAVLDELLGRVEDKDDLMQGEDIFEEEEESEPEEEAEEEPEASEEEAEDEEEETTDVDSDDLAQAIARLRRYGMSTEQIGLLGDADILELGEKFGKIQDDTDSAHKELNELKRTPQSTQAGANTAEAPQDSTSVPEPIKAVAEDWGMDEEGGERLAAAFDASMEPLRQENASLNTKLAALESRILRSEADVARQELAERFPQVQDPNSRKFQRVLSRMNSLQTTGEYVTTHELMEDAILIEFRDELKAEASKGNDKIRKARAKGSVTKPKVQPKSSPKDKKLSGSALEDAVLEMLDPAGPDDSTEAERLTKAKRLARKQLKRR